MKTRLFTVSALCLSIALLTLLVLGNAAPARARSQSTHFLALDSTPRSSNAPRLSQEYVFVRSWGTVGSGDGQLNCPVDVYIDRTGRAIVADYFNDRIQVFLANGTYVTQWTGFSRPEKIAQDSAGYYYIADNGNGRIVKLSGGTVVTTWPVAPRGLGVAPDDSIYVAGVRYIYKFWSDGQPVITWGNNGSVDVDPSGTLEAVRTDSIGNLYANSWASVFKLDSNGNPIATQPWGGFNFAQDVFIDQSNNVFVADTNNNRIQKFR